MKLLIANNAGLGWYDLEKGKKYRIVHYTPNLDIEHSFWNPMDAALEYMNSITIGDIIEHNTSDIEPNVRFQDLNNNKFMLPRDFLEVEFEEVL